MLCWVQGIQLATAGDDGRICVLTERPQGAAAPQKSQQQPAAFDEAFLFPHAQAYIRGLAWSTEGSVLYSGGWDGTIAASNVGKAASEPTQTVSA